MIALLIFTRRSDIMGQFTNGRLTNIAAIVGTAVVLGLNAFSDPADARRADSRFVWWGLTVAKWTQSCPLS